VLGATQGEAGAYRLVPDVAEQLRARHGSRHAVAYQYADADRQPDDHSAVERPSDHDSPSDDGSANHHPTAEPDSDGVPDHPQSDDAAE